MTPTLGWQPEPTLLEKIIALAERKGKTPEAIINEALEKYVELENHTLTQTRTWELCGSLEVSAPEAKYVVGQDEQGQPVTNYAEHVDDLLY